MASQKTNLKPLYHKLVEAQSKATGTSKSSVIAEGVKKYFDSMTVQQKDNLLNSIKKRE